MKKGSKFYSIATLTCPRCQSGGLYETKTWSFKKPFFMPANCPHCAQRYELETGFYYGSMFVSYIITAFIMFTVFALCKFLFEFDIVPSFVLVTALVLGLYVWIYRVSRAIWINFFVRFDPKFV